MKIASAPMTPSRGALREDIARLRAQLGVANAELATRAAPRAGAAGQSRGGWHRQRARRAGNRAFLEYWVGSENTYVWAISGGRLSWLRLAPSEQVERVARRLHESMRTYATTPVRDRLNQSAELHRLVIAPLSNELAGVIGAHARPGRAAALRALQHASRRVYHGSALSRAAVRDRLCAGAPSRFRVRTHVVRRSGRNRACFWWRTRSIAQTTRVCSVRLACVPTLIGWETFCACVPVWIRRNWSA